jgi:hypothetical protein
MLAALEDRWFLEREIGSGEAVLQGTQREVRPANRPTADGPDRTDRAGERRACATSAD